MKAITLWQPWATLIAEGYKTIETRGHDRFKCLVGQNIIIYAGQRYDENAINELATVNFNARKFLIEKEYNEGPLPAGVILCKAFVHDGRWLTGDDSIQACCSVEGKRYGLFLTGIKKFYAPLPMKGKQGIWECRQ